MKTNRNILIDCDPGTDDALALLLVSACLVSDFPNQGNHPTVASSNPALCFLSSYGNATLHHTHRNLLSLVEFLGLSGEIYRGAACPMGELPYTPTCYHGENGLCGISLPLSADTTVGGIDDAAQRIRGAERVTYVATGPLTNAAELLIRHPDVISHIEEIVIMGGGIGLGNMPSGAEYNFSLDPRAVAEVLACPIRKVLAPLNLTHTLAFLPDAVEEIVGATAAELRWDTLRRRDLFGEIFFRNLSSALTEGHKGAVIHDAATIAYLADPSCCSLEKVRLRCDAAGRIFEEDAANIGGASLGEVGTIKETGAEVFVIRSMDKQRLKALLHAAFSCDGEVKQPATYIV